MSKNDFNSAQDPLEEGDPLSATGMFLSSFGTPAQEASTAKEVPLAAPAAPRTDWPAPAQAAGSLGSVSNSKSASGPGEFTQMFQAMESRQSPAPAPVTPQPASSPAFSPAASVPSQPAQATPASAPVAGSGPGEFTRIFVSGATAPPEPKTAEPRTTEPRVVEQSARTVVEPPYIPPPASTPPRMKGFSTPGVSDSASAEGSFTQFFKATPPTPAAPAPVAPVQSYRPPPPPPQETKWQREPDFPAPAKPADSTTPQSVTGLMSALSSPGGPSSGQRQPEVAPYRPEPIPSYSPAPPPEPSSTESGSVTKLIQRLSQVQREAPPEPRMPIAAEAPKAAPVSAPLGEPGEFTRMISGDTVKAALSGAAAPAQPASAAAAPPPVAMPHLAVPTIAPPAITPPTITPPTVTGGGVHAPKVEPPKIAPPKITPPALPALAAPKSKLEGIVPVLLIINTFLLVVLLVVVIFALKAK